MRIFISLFALFILAGCQPAAKTSDPLAGLDHREGFIDLYVDKNKNKVLVKLPDADEDGVSLSDVADLDTMSEEVYRYLNFNEIDDFQHSADAAKVKFKDIPVNIQQAS